ncbi:DUF7003 family protein [Laceyella sediminis]|uniref:DUF7003 family protein n=1 Tax=Laceyella sediminis TaxID=573074 RepID=UPI003CCBC6FA
MNGTIKMKNLVSIIFFQQIANALEKNDATLISIKNTNTHWSNWGTHIQEEDY